MPPAWLEDVDAFARCPLWTSDSLWGGSYLDYVVDFYKARKASNVLVLCCEHMDACERAGSDAHVRAVAAFIGLEPGPAALAVATTAAGHDWARAHAAQFAEDWMYERQLAVARYSTRPLKPVPRIRKEKKTYPYARRRRIPPRTTSLH